MSHSQTDGSFEVPMANSNKINLINRRLGTVQDYAYDPNDTFGDLKSKIAEKADYTGKEKVEVCLGPIVLNDEFLIKDFSDLDDLGLFIEFSSYPITCTTDKDIFVWLGKKKCVKLYAGATKEVMKIPRNGHFAVTRSK